MKVQRVFTKFYSFSGLCKLVIVEDGSLPVFPVQRLVANGLQLKQYVITLLEQYADTVLWIVVVQVKPVTKVSCEGIDILNRKKKEKRNEKKRKKKELLLFLILCNGRAWDSQDQSSSKFQPARNLKQWILDSKVEFKDYN